MTVVWIDAPGSLLSTRSDAIDFEVSDVTAVVAISVSFGVGRLEERAYRDGQFLHPYLGSSRTAGTFALRRTGGWPADPVIYIDEGGGVALGDRVVDGAGNTVLDGSGNRVLP